MKLCGCKKNYRSIVEVIKLKSIFGRNRHFDKDEMASLINRIVVAVERCVHSMWDADFE